jgi:CRISPR type III-A-associated RAMP protein Csm4
MKVAKIPLKPFTRFHFGEFKIDHSIALNSTSAFAHSDTLFSAMVNSFSNLKEGAEDFISFFKSGEIQISSLFYYLENKSVCIYLLPKPVFLDLYCPSDGFHKKRNRIQFGSYGVWFDGFDPYEWLDDKGNINSTEYALIQDGEVLITRKEYNALGFKGDPFVFSIVDTPKSPIRAHHKASIYYQADVEIAKIENVTTGIFFFYKTQDADIENKLKTATNVMAFSGIGGETRNTGRTMEKPVFIEGLGFDGQGEGFETTYTNLSLLNPNDKDELKEIRYSKTILRGGAENYGVNAYDVLRMIREGAFIEKDTVMGSLVKIGRDIENRDVYRNGKAFIVPLKIKKA